MGFSLFSNNGKIQYGIKNYIADTIDDLKQIPKSSGSMVFVINTSKYYILNTNLTWVEQQETSAALPEQTKSVIPTYEQQIILPGPGMTLGSVMVEPIPDPTDTLEISENGKYNVARIGEVDINVPQGVFPRGTLNITDNGAKNVREYEYVNVNVSPQRTQTMLEVVDCSTLAEPVNRIVFDISKFDLSNYCAIWFELSNVETSAADWVYFSDSVASNYLRDSRRFTSYATVIVFVKTDVWRSVFPENSTHSRLPPNGNTQRLGNISVYCYNVNTKFISGEVKLYAV